MWKVTRVRETTQKPQPRGRWCSVIKCPTSCADSPCYRIWPIAEQISLKRCLAKKVAHALALLSTESSVHQAMPPHANIDYTSAVLYRSGNTPAAQLQSLGDDPGGSLRISNQHALVRVLADGLLEDDPDNNNFKIITMRDLEYLHITHLTFDGEIDQLSPYFIIKPPLWSRVWKDLNELGLEHEEGGHNWQSLWLLISNYMGKLTIDQRLVIMDDVEAHDGQLMENHMDYITPNRLRQSDTNNSILLELRQMTPGFYHHDQWGEEPFSIAVHDLVPTYAESKSDQQKASAIIQLLRSTRTFSTGVRYYPADQAPDEINRRTMGSEPDRFRPIFEVLWATDYPDLISIFHRDSQGSHVAEMLKSAITQVSIGTELTPATVQGFVSSYKKRQHLVQLTMDDDDDATLQNATRLEAAVNIMGQRGIKASDADGSAEYSNSPAGSCKTVKDTQEQLETISKQESF